MPVSGVSISGPQSFPAGQVGWYIATYVPPIATLPITFTWDNGTVGPTAAYSWALPGAYTITVTGTNACGGPVSASLSVQVFCQPLEGVAVSGPGALLVGQEGFYRASPQPITASLPLTFTWDNGTMGPTALYSWPATGAYTITVTGTNLCGGEAVGRLPVRVLSGWPYSVYLPLVFRNRAP